jgi:eukaryotic-like serine/threonine-protein kinase
LLIGVSYGLYAFLHQSPPATIPFQQTKITRLTATGKVEDAAISPDGKYVAYVEVEKGLRSLWVKHVPTGRTLPIIPAAEVYYWGVTFSNDSNQIYFVTNAKVDKWELYTVAVLGGSPPRKLLEHLDSAVTFSPDGKRFAFLRAFLEKGETQLIVANADGAEEQIIATRKRPDIFYVSGLVRIAWSPDEKLIACPAIHKDATGWYQSVVGVEIENRSQRSLTNQRWRQILQVAWLADGSGLALNGVYDEELPAFVNPQLWHVSYPSGEVHKITNDLNAYNNISLAADSRTLVTTQRNRISNVWIVPKGDTSRAKQLTSGTTDGMAGLAWTPDGKIVYRSMASGSADLWLMDADGSNQRQLTHEAHNADPAVSIDGRYIFYTLTRSGKSHIWRMDADGSNKNN